MISSSKNPLVKQVRRLARSKRAREQAGLFLVEGIQGVVEAVRSRAPLEVILYAPELLSSEIALEAIGEATGRGVRCEPLAGELFELFSARDNPVGIAALVQRQDVALETVPVTPQSLFVALTEISDPGNLGTIVRTMDAVGADALLLVGQTVDPFHPTAAKASAGTIFGMPLVPVASVETLLAWARRANIHVVATSDQGESPYWSLRYPTPLLLVMGSEAHGLPLEVLGTVPHVARIPMRGSADSLNLAIATALLLYEVRRQQGEV